MRIRLLVTIIPILFLIPWFFYWPPSLTQNVQVIVVFKEKALPEVVEQHGGEVIAAYQIIPGVAARIPSQALEKLKQNPAVSYVELDREVRALAQETPWGVRRIGADVAWSITKGTGVKVAILDTGIDYNHPDLDANIKGGIDLVGKGYSTNPRDWNDKNGHGTHCAGIVAAEDNSIGVVGVAPEASLYAVKVLNDGGLGFTSDIIEGIDWCASNGIQVISMSFGSSAPSDAERQACNNASNLGLLLVAAAGNDGPSNNTINYPAGYDSVIAVGATDSSDQIAYFSSRGTQIELVAPGVSIYSTYKGDDYATLSGTSMSCPHVSGTAALIWAAFPSWTNTQVRAQLQETAGDFGPAGRDSIYGYGIVNASKAVLYPTPIPEFPGLMWLAIMAACILYLGFCYIRALGPFI
ncbi:MAG: S8 family peptidase [Euryarchaeota archaeon]|nr:S8 family peptidase [Euryarchaeota archaeon]